MQQTKCQSPVPGSESHACFPNDASVQPPCQFACPIHQDVRAYVALSGLGRFKEASAIIRQTNPLPFICGTICAHPCETRCRREKVDQPVSIRALKRCSLEHGGDWPVTPVTPAGPFKVAIIGSGPAGLTAAHDLAQLGFLVTIFERDEMPGGALSSAVPRYRLPRHVLLQDVNNIRALGVEIRIGVSLGRDLGLEQLKRDGFAAILLAMGLPVSRSLNIPGVSHENVLLALPFLRAVNSGHFQFPPGREVIVIGGGNVAMDVARSAVRCGAAKVKLVCLEARHEMPAFPWEIEEAVEEGIEVNCSLGPKELLIEQCDVSGLQCRAVRAVFDSEGRFNPSFHEDRLSTITGNAVIVAIGQAPDVQCLKGSQVGVTERGQVVHDRDTLATTEEGVFLCGEMALGPATAVQAMASGRKAAGSIARRLLGDKAPDPHGNPPEELGEISGATALKVKRIGRLPVPAATPGERARNLDPVELGYSADGAVVEARRCLSCGAGAYRIPDRCVECLTCVRLCPYGAPVVTASSSVDIRVDQCQGCGLCVGECPAGAIGFRKPGEVDLRQQIRAALNGLAAGPRIVTFCCTLLLREKDIENDPRPGWLRVPCVSRVDVNTMLFAFEQGADGVVVASCQDDSCPYRQTTQWAERRVKTARDSLKGLGVAADCLRYRSIPAGDYRQLELLADEMARRS